MSTKPRGRIGGNRSDRNGTDRNRQKSRRAKSVLKAVILLEMLAIGVVVYALRLSMRAGGNEGRDSLTGISEVFRLFGYGTC